jgi:hypothetical protein
MNPHARFYVDVKDASGQVTNWNFELGSPNVLKQGDVVTVDGYLAKDGAKAFANARRVVLANGKSVFAGSSVVGSDGVSVPGGIEILGMAASVQKRLAVRCGCCLQTALPEPKRVGMIFDGNGFIRGTPAGRQRSSGSSFERLSARSFWIFSARGSISGFPASTVRGEYQTPEKSGLPSGIRGMGPVGPTRVFDRGFPSAPVMLPP